MASQWTTTAFGDLLSATFDAQHYRARGEGRYRLASPRRRDARRRCADADLRHTGLAETGALVGGFGLAYQGRRASDTRTELGAKLDHVVALQPDLALALRGGAAWAHDWVSDPTLLASFQTLPGAGLSRRGWRRVKNAALVSSGVELRFAEGATIGARFDGGFTRHGQTHAGGVKIDESRASPATFAHAYRANVGHAARLALRILRNCLRLLARPRGFEPLFSP